MLVKLTWLHRSHEEQALLHLSIRLLVRLCEIWESKTCIL
jgi:hypothetical protein